MSTIKNRLSETIRNMQSGDKILAEELAELRNKKNITTEERARVTAIEPELRGTEVEEVFGPEGLDMNIDLAMETIVLRVGRPVLTIKNDEAVLDITEAESQVWKDRIKNAKPQLIHAAKAVGRIELEYDPNFAWVGTGWLVAENIIVTNRHVASVFGTRRGTSFVFRQGNEGKTIKASVDFLQEANRADQLLFRIKKILHIERDNGPDMAFLEVEQTNPRQLAEPIRLASNLPGINRQVAVIGYPARDSRIPDQPLMSQIFGDLYDKKRLAPGQVTLSDERSLQHDCSTLGGNSGSSIIDIQTGDAVGLHYAGRFLHANYSVPAAIISDRLYKLKHSSPSRRTSYAYDQPGPQNQNGTHQQVNDGAVSFTVPVTISVSIGQVAPAQNTVQNSVQNKPAQQLPQAPVYREADEMFITEGVPADYDDRTGYDPDFLGDVNPVPLPEVTDESMAQDILAFDLNGEEHNVLHYTHFSLQMSKSRRLCFYSAVNIDGKTSKSMKRGAWRLDPRIPAEAQIMKECYGDPPKFSRGHMTRREDPIWGTAAEAAKGNGDSMHVTNAVPQMQTMNGGVWLQLENYALQNARKDDQRISVFTGPVLTDDDPLHYNVAVPLAFWKVIVFIHDETNELCATGYRMSHAEFLPEFVYGEFKTHQVSISSIEDETGLSFGDLSSLDPFEEMTEVPVKPITRLSQIRFR